MYQSFTFRSNLDRWSRLRQGKVNSCFTRRAPRSGRWLVRRSLGSCRWWPLWRLISSFALTWSTIAKSSPLREFMGDGHHFQRVATTLSTSCRDDILSSGYTTFVSEGEHLNIAMTRWLRGNGGELIPVAKPTRVWLPCFFLFFNWPVPVHGEIPRAWASRGMLIGVAFNDSGSWYNPCA